MFADWKIDWYKAKRSIRISYFLLAFMLANVLFWASWHNLDLLQNYSLMTNDFNREHSINFFDVRDVTDCNLFGCGQFQEIYIMSKSVALLSYLIFNGIIGQFLIMRFKELDDKTRH